MILSDHSLRQIDEDSIGSLSEDAVRVLAIKLLHDLKQARERVNQNARNSSVPPGSEAPWDKDLKELDEADTESLKEQADSDAASSKENNNRQPEAPS